jgi:hypothetical protein
MTTWNPSDKGSNIALSGGNLAMTASGSGGPTTQWCRTTTAKSSGKSVIRITGDLLDGVNAYNQVGLSTASSTTYDGSDATSMLLYRQGSDEWDLRYNGSRIAFEYPTSSFPTMPDGTGDVLDIYLDLDNDLIYFKLNGNFFLNSVNYPSHADPTVPTGGVPIDHKTWFIHNSIFVPGYGGVTLDPSPTGLPAGWSAWDAATGITGTLGATEVKDVAAFTGTAAAAGVTGTLAATEAQDVAAFTGTTRWVATLAATEAPDVAALTGATRWDATLAATEVADVAAITGVGAATAWEYIGTTTTVVETTTTTHTLSLTGLAARQAGDLLVACIGYRSSSSTSVTLPSGWTLVNEQKNNDTTVGNAGTAGAVMAYIIRGASDPALTFTHPAGISVALGTIVGYRPAQGPALDTSSAATTATNISSVSVTGLTTTGLNELLVELASSGNKAAWGTFDAVTDPTTASTTGGQTAHPTIGTWLERTDFLTTSGADVSIAVADAVKATAGATGNFTSVASIGGGNAIIVGAFKFDSISGVIVATEAPDVAAIAATVSGIAGTLGATEAPDVAAFTGNVRWTTILAATEAPDVASITAAVRWSAVLAATETPDTAAFTGNTRWNVTLAATEAADVAAFTGTTRWLATLAAVEAQDVAVITGTVFTAGTITGSLNATEASDVAALTGAVTGNAGILAATEAPDVAAVAATVRWTAILAALENADTAAFTGTVSAPATVTGILNAIEASDIAFFTGNVFVEPGPEPGPEPLPLKQPGVLKFGRRVTINRW